MFYEHKGHDLSLLEDAVKTLEKQMHGLFENYVKLHSQDSSQTESKLFFIISTVNGL